MAEYDILKGGPVPGASLVVLSLGAGTQSSALAIAAERGDFGLRRPDAAIFADTGAEPKAVYDYLAFVEANVSFPIYRVSKGNIVDDAHARWNGTAKRFASAPFYTVDGNGKRGQFPRHCTKEYKIEPVVKKTRELLGVPYRARVPKGVIVEHWLGISSDEIQRASRSRHKWQINRFPLIEMRWKRHHAIEYLTNAFGDNAPPPPRSACAFCPYRSNAEWLDIKNTDPERWREAVELDKAIRQSPDGANQMSFLHADCVPLEDADLENKKSAAQFSFLNECDGVCGT